MQDLEALHKIKFMQIKLFTIPAFHSETATGEMNKFLRSHRVLEVQQEFVATQNGAYWCYSIKYIKGENNIYNNRKEKKDYRQILDKKNFEIFEKLREHRKEIAKNDVVPAYAVFTDAELAEMAKLSDITKQSIKNIKGIGEKRVEKYGKLIVEMLKKNETSGQADK